MNNKIFDFSSNFNISTKEWIIYDKNFLLISMNVKKGVR